MQLVAGNFMNRITGVLAVAVLLSSISFGQTASQSVPDGPKPQAQQFEVRDYSKPRSHFPNPIAPYTSQNVPLSSGANTPRLDELLKDGKLVLSLDDAIALALENNLDIAIARYNLNIADTDVLRAKAGASTLGVNTGVVQNTPGGGVGGLGGLVGTGTGGTTVGQGGAGTGTGGLVISTLGSGPNITSFDPILSSTIQWDHQSSVCTNFFCGTQQNTNTANFSYLQGFATGTNIAVGFNNSRTASNNPITTISPLLNSNFRFQLSQHLLQGFGFAPNNRFIHIAKNNRQISDVAFHLQVLSTVNQVQTMYWDLVYAYQYAQVQQESLAFAQKTLSDTQKQVEIGTLAPIEVVRAQSTVATDQQSLTLALTNLQLQQLLIKNALSRTLQDPRLADAAVVPTSTMEVPATEPVTPIEDLVKNGLDHRQELSEARLTLANDEISIKAVHSALLPTLDLFAYYGGSGVGGSQNPANICPTTGTQPPFCNPAGSIPNQGYTDTLSQLVDSTAPDKGIGFTLNIPLRNRAAQATQVRSLLEYRQAQMRLQQLENQVRIEVRNAQFTLQQNRASVEAAQAAVELAKQSLDAENKKYTLGASTTTLVLQNRTALTQAQSTLVSATAAYQKSRIELDRATGLTLEHYGIIMDDAVRGQVTKSPHVPFVTDKPQTP